MFQPFSPLPSQPRPLGGGTNKRIRLVACYESSLQRLSRLLIRTRLAQQLVHGQVLQVDDHGKLGHVLLVALAPGAHLADGPLAHVDDRAQVVFFGDVVQQAPDVQPAVGVDQNGAAELVLAAQIQREVAQDDARWLPLVDDAVHLIAAAPFQSLLAT